MKKMKKIFALMIAMVMVLGLAITTNAASITITRDDSYSGTGDGRTYSYYKVFSADPSADFDGTTFVGGYETDGTAVTEQGDGKVAYTATSTVAAKLGTIDATTKAWTTNTGNKWFDLTYAPGTDNYVVQWRNGVQPTAANVQEAAAWLIANGAYESGPIALTFSGTTWTSGDIDEGYYIISGDTGDNLVAATTDIEIKEKNDYPPTDKTQADEDNTQQVDTEKNVAIGDVLTYQAKVTIPKTAKVGDTMVVTDTPSEGLTYTADSVTVKENTGNATVNLTTPAPTGNQAWAATITVTEGSQGKDVIFEYPMTVNEKALVDTGRINTFELKFGDKYTAEPQTVPYTTYFSGIEKVDGDNTELKLENVEFMLKEGDAEFKVTKHADGYYYYDANGSSTVKTDADGKIIIRGLDKDKTYTLTETANPNDGYNMLSGPVTLTLVEDEGNAYTTATFDQVKNNKGTVLPSTGGIGTTIFYVVGAILVIGAGVVLVTRRRMDAQ